MLVDTENHVSAETFRKEFKRYVTAANEGRGPVAITEDSRVIGVSCRRRTTMRYTARRFVSS